MIERVDLSLVYPENKLYLDYVAYAASAVSLFSHSPEEFAQALTERRAVDSFNYQRIVPQYEAIYERVLSH